VPYWQKYSHLPLLGLERSKDERIVMPHVRAVPEQVPYGTFVGSVLVAELKIGKNVLDQSVEVISDFGLFERCI
jgi:hypothetical protein